MAARVLDRLFAQIVDAPDDDAARLVYADALLEGIEPLRGELIALQVARAAGSASHDQLARERALIADGQLAPLAQPLALACRSVTLERGFPAGVRLAWRGLEQVVEAAEWGTVRRIASVHEAPSGALRALLASGRLPNLVEVHDIPTARLAELAPYAGRWRHVGLIGGDARRELAALAQLPALRRLTVRLASSGMCKAIAAQRIPIEELGVHTSLAGAADWLAALPGVRHLTLYDHDLLQRSLDFDWSVLAALLELPRLTRVTLTVPRDRWDGAVLTARLERTTQGWTVVWPCGERGSEFWLDVVEIALDLRRLVSRVVIEPSQPLHYAAPFSDVRGVSIAQIIDAWAPVPVELREPVRWLDLASAEGGAEGAVVAG